MNKSFSIAIAVLALLVAAWALVFTYQTNTATDLTCEPCEEVPAACDDVVAEPEVEEIDTDLITFDVKDGGDLVVYYDGEEKMQTTITAGWVDGTSVIAQDGDYVYVNIAPDGMGGYILYTGYMWMFRIDTSDWTYIQLPIDGFVTDLSIEHGKMVMKENSGSRMMISVYDLETFEKASYPVDAQYGQAGDAHLSPDGTKVAYAVAVGDPTDEQGAVYLIDLEEGSHEEYAPHKRGIYKVAGWTDNETVDYSWR